MESECRMPGMEKSIHVFTTFCTIYMLHAILIVEFYYIFCIHCISFFIVNQNAYVDSSPYSDTIRMERK